MMPPVSHPLPAAPVEPIRAAPASRLALRADLLDFTADPGWGAPVSPDLLTPGVPGVRFRPDHWLLIEGDRIVGAQPHDPGEGWRGFDVDCKT